jgi:hypothetical protein
MRFPGGCAPPRGGAAEALGTRGRSFDLSFPLGHSGELSWPPGRVPTSGSSTPPI